MATLSCHSVSRIDPIEYAHYPNLDDFVCAYKLAPVEELEETIEKGVLRVMPRTQKIYVPPSLRERVLIACHNEDARHQGKNKTYKRLRQLFFWPKMSEAVSDHIDRCLVCVGLRGSPHPKHRTPMSSLDYPCALEFVS